MKKRIVSLFLAAMLAVNASVAVAAVEPEKDIADEMIEISFEASAIEVETEIHVNPIYKDVITEDDLRPITVSGDSQIGRSLGVENAYTSVEDAICDVRTQMKNRVEEIKISVKLGLDSERPTAAIMDGATEHTGVGTEGDYLEWQYGGWKAETRTITYPAEYKVYEITYALTYYTTLEQENELTEAINNGLPGLDFSEAETDYEKLKVVYDWVTSNVTYDYDNLKNTDYKLQFTAYAAAINGTAVCQGYGNLCYRLILDFTDVDCRLIAGKAGPKLDNHAWNIVKLGDLYYNIDSTWDAGEEEYDYFLKGSENFTDHTPFTDSDEHYYGYYTPEFLATYPVSETDYELSGEPEPVVHSPEVTIEAKEPTCTEDGWSEGTVCEYHPDDENDPCYKASEVIQKLGHTIVIDEAVEATTEQTGLTEGSHCSVCGEILAEQQEIPRLVDHEALISEAETFVYSLNSQYMTIGGNEAKGFKYKHLTSGEIYVDVNDTVSEITLYGHNRNTGVWEEVPPEAEYQPRTIITNRWHNGRILGYSYSYLYDEYCVICENPSDTDVEMLISYGFAGEVTYINYLTDSLSVPADGKWHVFETWNAQERQIYLNTHPETVEIRALSSDTRCRNYAFGGGTQTSILTVGGLMEDRIALRNTGSAAETVKFVISANSDFDKVQVDETITAQPGEAGIYLVDRETAQDRIVGIYAEYVKADGSFCRVIDSVGNSYDLDENEEPKWFSDFLDEVLIISAGDSAATVTLRGLEQYEEVLKKEAMDLEIPAYSQISISVDATVVPEFMIMKTGTVNTSLKYCVNTSDGLWSSQRPVPAAFESGNCSAYNSYTVVIRNFSNSTEIVTISPVIHTAKVVKPVKAATCTTDGNTEGTVCEAHPNSTTDPCYKASEVIPKLGHTIVIDKAVAATTEKTGLTEGSHCSVCKTVIKKQEVIEKLAPEKPVVPAEEVFTDVSSGRYYTNAITWAVANNVTTGTSKTTFSPEDPCTRAQVVTFLWRAEGEPEPKTKVSPFTDVQDASRYYYKAVLWAVENGVTTGTSKTTFSPDDTVTRGQFVTFLYRAEGSDVSSVKNPFTDVDTGKFYAKPVLWAFSNGVTTGTSKTTFSPEAPCIRGQVVTFLHRAME